MMSTYMYDDTYFFNLKIILTSFIGVFFVLLVYTLPRLFLDLKLYWDHKLNGLKWARLRLPSRCSCQTFIIRIYYLPSKGCYYHVKVTSFQNNKGVLIILMACRLPFFFKSEKLMIPSSSDQNKPAEYPDICNTCLKRIFNIGWSGKDHIWRILEESSTKPIDIQIRRNMVGLDAPKWSQLASSNTNQVLSWKPQGKGKREDPDTTPGGVT